MDLSWIVIYLFLGMIVIFLQGVFEEMLKLLAKGKGFRVKSNHFPMKGVSSK
jgi:hypothetical protein